MTYPRPCAHSATGLELLSLEPYPGAVRRASGDPVAADGWEIQTLTVARVCATCKHVVATATFTSDGRKVPADADVPPTTKEGEA